MYDVYIASRCVLICNEYLPSSLSLPHVTSMDISTLKNEHDLNRIRALILYSNCQLSSSPW
jgi:hypothetical protein